MCVPKSWQALDSDLAVQADANRARSGDLRGARFAVLVVDPIQGLVAASPQSGAGGLTAGPVGEAGKAGKAGKAVLRIAGFLDQARQLGSVVLSRPLVVPSAATGGTVKRDRLAVSTSGSGDPRLAWKGPLRPRVEGLFLDNAKPSASFGMALVAHLVDRRIDTVVVAGCTTSGCVRATVTDGISYGFRVLIAEDCVFDDVELSGAVSLHDVNRNYADVRPWRSILTDLRGEVAA